MKSRRNEAVIECGMSEEGYLSKTTSVVKVERVTRLASRAVATRKN